MGVELRPLVAADAEAHCAGEDEETVRWLTGGYGTVDGTRRHFEALAESAAAGEGKALSARAVRGVVAAASTGRDLAQTSPPLS